MRNPSKILLGLGLLLPCVFLTAKEETFPLYEDHRIAVAVPEGYTFTRVSTDEGVIIVKISDPKQETNLEISFLPDPDGHFSTPRARREFIVETFQKYVEGSVEKEMRFTELKPRVGTATACVFTDASLVGKPEFPRGEYLNATTGLKAWPGCAAYFTLLSNDTTSPAYDAALKIITDSVHDKKPLAAF
jgi:hypothetical protein